MLARLVTDRVLWSPCPSTRELEDLAARGLRLVVNLTYECVGYSVPEGVEVIHYPIPDFYFRPPEDFAYKVLEPLRRWLKSEEGLVLVHCVGGIGRSGTAVAMLLVYAMGYSPEEALGTVRRLGGGPQSLVQLFSFRWLIRDLRLLGRSGLLRVYEAGSAYGFGRGVAHASTVANIALDVAERLAPRADLRLLRALYVAGMLHGVVEEGVRPSEATDALAGLAEPRDVEGLLSEYMKLVRGEKSPGTREVEVLAASIWVADSFYDVFGFEESYGGVERVGRRVVARGVDYAGSLEERLRELCRALGLECVVTPP